MATAESLTERIDALAEALRAAGVSADRVSTILGSAATATMHALMLDVVLDENAEAAQHVEPAAPTEQTPVEPLRVAA
jgi:hypothetical protein